ncbi:hypothetical protein HYW55_05135 [Candidatus Gottesmanbacteria bacterium]|nr:hypothetical protein [Candidatus Gottesmanbacteria bacterium]
MNRHKTFFLVILVLMFISLFFVIVFFTNGRSSTRSSSMVLSEPSLVEESRKGIQDEKTLLTQYWTERIQTVSSEKAYSELTGIPSRYNRSQHLAAHIFGELLYNFDGVPGILICDSRYAYGCFHGFFGNAIQEKGLDIVGEANTQCIEKGGVNETGCRHGIGHGVLEHLGNLSIEAVFQALDTCKKIQTPSILGCTQGVFMEYNFPSSERTDTSTSERRTQDVTKPFAPCDEIPLEHKASCYFELGEWWNESIDPDFKQLRTHCRFLNKEIYEACLTGIGRAIGQLTNFDIDGVQKKCSAFREESDRTFCFSGAYWVFTAVESQKEKAKFLCPENIGGERICQKVAQKIYE